MGKKAIQTRTALPGDAAQIAYVHVTSWKTTYAGMIDADYLVQLTPESRFPLWKRVIEESRTNAEEILFVALVSGKIVGFVSGGKNRGGETDYAAELKAIYLLQEHQGRGVGSCLFIEFVLALIRRGYNSMILWVLETNAARTFYERMGGILQSGSKDVQIGKTSARHVAYAWKDLNASINGSSNADKNQLH